MGQPMTPADQQTALAKNTPIYVAGHRGMVGQALVRALHRDGYRSLITATHAQLDLTDQGAVRQFFAKEKPQVVFLAAAKVGGIHANNTYRADFIYQNLAIQTNVMESAYRAGVQRLLFLGSSCIYPKNAPQPMAESALLTGPLEPTNQPYAIAKISGIEMAWSYNRQYGTRFLAVMPTNLYGVGDTYHPDNSHVIPGLIRRTDECKRSGAKELVIWGTGTPKREFMDSEDMANACVYLMTLPPHRVDSLFSDQTPPLVNIGTGQELSIADLARLICEVVGFKGHLRFDADKLDGTPRKLLDIDRLTQLGWRAQISLKAGLERAYADYLQRSHPA